MKQNPFLIGLTAAGLVGVVVGVVLTILSITGYNVPAFVGSIGALAFILGVGAGAGALVLAGIEWRART